MMSEKVCPKCLITMERFGRAYEYKCPKCKKWYKSKNNYSIGKGSTVQRLTKKLIAQLEKQYGFKISWIELYPVQGAWRHIRMDVQPWSGQFLIDGSDNPHILGSWSTMTNCLKYGFDIEIDDLEYSVNHRE